MMAPLPGGGMLDFEHKVYSYRCGFVGFEVYQILTLSLQKLPKPYKVGVRLQSRVGDWEHLCDSYGHHWQAHYNPSRSTATLHCDEGAMVDELFRQECIMSSVLCSLLHLYGCTTSARDIERARWHALLAVCCTDSSYVLLR